MNSNVCKFQIANDSKMTQKWPQNDSKMTENEGNNNAMDMAAILGPDFRSKVKVVYGRGGAERGGGGANRYALCTVLHCTTSTSWKYISLMSDCVLWKMLGDIAIQHRVETGSRSLWWAPTAASCSTITTNFQSTTTPDRNSCTNRYDNKLT